MSTCTVRIMTDEEIWEEKKKRLLADIDAAIDEGADDGDTLELMKTFINSAKIRRMEAYKV